MLCMILYVLYMCVCMSFASACMIHIIFNYIVCLVWCCVYDSVCVYMTVCMYFACFCLCLTRFVVWRLHVCMILYVFTWFVVWTFKTIVVWFCMRLHDICVCLFFTLLCMLLYVFYMICVHFCNVFIYSYTHGHATRHTKHHVENIQNQTHLQKPYTTSCKTHTE